MTIETRKSNSEEYFDVKVIYPEYVKVIEQSKDVDIHALIGNIGGYVGLFLGIRMILVLLILTFLDIIC